MKTEEKQDKVKVFANIMAYAPWLVLRVGVAYLRMRRHVNKTSRSFEKGLLSKGMPPHMARRLAYSYQEDLSIRRLIGKMPGSDFMRRGAW